MNANRKKLMSWNHLETEYAVTGRFRPETRLPNTGSLRARYEEGNFRRSHALSMAGEADLLEELKALISRGSAVESAALHERLEALNDGDEQMTLELALQGCRIAMLFGTWTDAVERCTRLERESELPALSRFSTLQIRAHAFLELMDYTSATRDLQKAEALGELFPFAPVRFYSRILSAKLRSRTEGVNAAKKDLSDLWEEWRILPPAQNMDPALALLRLEIDFARLEGREHVDFAVVSYLVARHLGDDLYAGLAWFDLSVAGALGADWKSDARLTRFRNEHPRLASLWSAVKTPQSDEDSCGEDTALSIRNWLNINPSTSHAPTDPTRFDRIEHIVFLDRGISLDFAKGEASANPVIAPRSLALLRAVAHGAISKEKVFTQVWGISRFSKEKHDPAIRTALRRLRKQSGYEIESTEGELRLDPKIWVIVTS